MKVILTCLDTLRADRLSYLGYRPGLTPNLDRIAGEGALFGQAFTADIPTQPSHTAIFSGRYGIRTGIVSHFWPHAVLSPSEPWLPAVLEGSGYRTAAVDNLVNMKDWFIRGWEHYLKPRGRTRADGAEVNELAIPWLERHRDEDFLLFLHYWDAHIPYLPPEPFKSRWAAPPTEASAEVAEVLARSPTHALFKARHYDLLGPIGSLDQISSLYDAEIAYLDHLLGELVAALERLGIYDDTLLVVFADHGENMYEHDAWWDHAGLYDAVVHVPLIVRHPPSIRPSRHDAMVQLIDVAPTVYEAAGVSPPPGLDGRSLWPLLRGESGEHRREVFLSECTWEAKRALRTPEWKYITCYDPGLYGRREPELYDLRADPAETDNLAASRPELVRQLHARIDRWLQDGLQGRPDPFQAVIDDGLPAVKWMREVVAGMSEAEAERDHQPA